MMRAVKFSAAIVVLMGVVSVLSAAEEAKGTIKSVDKERKEVILKGTISDSRYELNKDATCWLDGVACKLTDLAADDRAVIIYEKKGDHMMAMQVRGLRKAQESSGTVNDVFGEKHEITLKGTIKNSTYELKKDATVYIDGKKANLTDIRAGDSVTVTYEQHGDKMIANDVTLVKRK
jgi:Cu/Ag efflux protein CusF